MSTAVPAWPRIEAITREDGSGEVTITGTSHPIATASLEDARAAIISLVAQTATKVARPVRVTTAGPDGRWRLIVHPDATVEADESTEARSSRPGGRAPRRRP